MRTQYFYIKCVLRIERRGRKENGFNLMYFLNNMGRIINPMEIELGLIIAELGRIISDIPISDRYCKPWSN